MFGIQTYLQSLKCVHKGDIYELSTLLKCSLIPGKLFPNDNGDYTIIEITNYKKIDAGKKIAFAIYFQNANYNLSHDILFEIEEIKQGES